MKKDFHPQTNETTITCTCGAVYDTISTVKNLRIGICAGCHPFFTGEQRFVDTAGRVDRFMMRLERREQRAQQVQTAQARSDEATKAKPAGKGRK